jgi:hypothetical protein
MKAIALLAFLLVFAPAAQAQVLTTADTVGRGVQGLLVSENRIFVDGVRLHLVVGQYVRGLTPSFDLYVLASGTRTDDETGASVVNQLSAGAGGNWRIGRWRGFSASVFGVVSAALTRRSQASDVLANPAVVVSRTVVEDRLALYTGVNALVPIGHRRRGWFTSPPAGS